jgi:hypothetical protein
MADFVAVLRKTIEGLPDNSPAMRGKVYEKARATVAAKLAAIDPPPPAAVAARQKEVLEEAIREVEADYGAADGDDPFAELENMLADPVRKPQPAAPSFVKPATPAPAFPAPAGEAPSFGARPAAPSAPALAGSQADPKAWQADGRRPDDLLPAGRQQEASQAETPGPTPFDVDEVFDDEDGTEPDRFEEPRRRRNFVPLIAAAVALLVIAGGGYAVWLNKDDFMAMLGIAGEAVATAPAAGDTAPVNPAPATAMKSSVNDGETTSVQKFTQRLNADGTEIDPGPAGGIASIGEGTSVASATQSPAPAAETTTPDPATGTADATTNTTAADDGAPTTANTSAETGAPAAGSGTAVQPAATADASADSQVAVGQKAIFYEERTNLAQGSAEPGSVVWSLVQESPGDNQPAEPAIRAEATIPGKDLQLRMTIRRNTDKTLPASHIIELIFLTPDNFEGGGIDNILRVALKDTEETAGSPLLGIPAKIADGYFLVALNDSKAEIATNLGLLKREQWIDVPMVYKSGRRALFTLEKGVPGDKVFDEAIKAWEAATASAG